MTDTVWLHVYKQWLDSIKKCQVADIILGLEQ